MSDEPEQMPNLGIVSIWLCYFLTRTATTDSCLRHFQSAKIPKLAQAKTDITRWLSTLFADAAAHSTKLPTTDMAFPGNYMFILFHNVTATREPNLSPV